jgi:Kef-type K+ transport system membrane component KefB
VTLVSAWSPLIAAALSDHGVARLMAVLAATLVATKVLGEVAVRLRQPAVLGELVAGVLLGGSVLGILDPADPVVAALAEIGVVVLLFQAGLHTDLGSLLSVGGAASAVAVAGVALPMILGYAAITAMGVPQMPAIVCAAALCATSIGISARVLSELNVLESPEGRVVLGAAVIDDIIGLIILAVVASAVSGEGVRVLGVVRMAAIAVGFVIVAVAVGGPVATLGERGAKRFKSSGTLGLMALAFAFLLAWLADLSGSALIVGAFAAGLVFDARHDRHEIERSTSMVGFFFVPIFFASVGASVSLDALATPRALSVGAVLSLVGIAGKVAAGFVPFWFGGRRLLVGIAMVPRGEVGLIFAQMGLASGGIDAGLFGAVMMMVLVTTLVTPPLLARVVRRTEVAPQAREELTLQGHWGIDDFVAGHGPPSGAARSDLPPDRRDEPGG